MTTPDLTGNQTTDDTLARRIAELQALHPWMEPQTSTTLAASPTSDSELHTIADGLKSQVQKTWDGISHFFDDPVLEKAPTRSMALQRYITGALGPSPVTDVSLLHIQKTLQDKGFGKDLPMNGVWDAGWQSALSGHAQEEYNKQLSGDKPGSVSSHGFLHSLMDSITPSGVGSSIMGFVKSIPSDLGQLAGDVGASAKDSAGAVFDWRTYAIGSKGAEEARKEAQKNNAKTSVAIQNKLGANKYREAVGLPQQTTENYNTLSNGINDIGTLFLLSGGGSAAQGVKAAFTKESGKLLVRDLTTQEAMRGPGVIAKSFLTNLGTKAVTGGVVGGVLGGAQAAARGEDIGAGIGAGLGGGALTGALIPKRFYDNIPVAKNTGPILGKLADADGLYYRTRTRLATPYQFGAVRATGTAMSQAQAFSLKAHGVAYLEGLVGGQQAGDIKAGIETSRPLDPINDAIANRLGFTAAGIHFAPDLDSLMYVLHGPSEVGAVGTTSRSVKQTIGGGTEALHEGLQNVGAIGQVEQALGKSFQSLIPLAGGDVNRVNLWISNKVKSAAAHMVAEENLGKIDPQTLSAMHIDDKQDFLKAASAEVWNDNDAMHAAVGRMMAGHPEYLQTQIKAELSAGQVRPNAYLKHQLSDYLDAGDELTHNVLTHMDHLLTPQEQTVLKRGVDPSLFGGSGGIPDGLFDNVKVMGKGEIPAGNIGLARTTTLTSQQALRDLKKFKTELDGIDPADTRAISQWQTKMHDYLFENHGLDAKKLDALTGDPQLTVNLLADRAKRLASEVHIPDDAPQALKDAFAKINDRGYQVVVGKDIGHAYRSDLAPITDLGAPLTRARRIASKMGLNTQQFSHVDYGVDRRLRITSALQARVDEGKLTLPPYYTVQTLLNDLQDDDIVGKELPWAGHMAFSAARRFHKAAAEALVRSGHAPDEATALAQMESEIASASGLRQLRVKDVRKVLGRTDKVPWSSRTVGEDGLLDAGNTIPLMDQKSIDEVYKALQQGFSETPAYMLGAQKMEDFARYLPFRANDRLAKMHLPQLPLGAVALPTRLAALRDTYRFNLSPFFSLRRIAKTNIKMGIDGVTPQANPAKWLQENKQWDAAHTSLDRLQGEATGRYKYLDEADRYLDSQDVFGLYNPRHYEAYYVAQKTAAGASDEEIKAGLVRVFQYGKDGKEGRTAMERTTNVIFFPFSFEKTVARNVGSYLLDKPAQAMILDNALNAYADFNNNHQNNPLSQAWIAKHAPVLEEALRLNTFAHGFSMGELGGVNRPVLNAFLPQSWASDKDTSKTLARFVPATADLKRIMGEANEQTTIIHTALSNGLATIEGKQSHGLLNQRQSAETSFAQRNDARQFRSELVADFKDVIDYNNTTDDDTSKYHFGYGPGIPDNLHGAVINKTNIGFIVAHRYPAYDPLAGAAYAIQKKTAAEQFVNSYPDPALRSKYQDFYKKAETAITHLNKDEYPDEQAAQVQELFRQAAIDYAHNDPKFFRFYESTFASSFGPLRAVQG